MCTCHCLDLAHRQKQVELHSLAASHPWQHAMRSFGKANGLGAGADWRTHPTGTVGGLQIGIDTTGEGKAWIISQVLQPKIDCCARCEAFSKCCEHRAES